MSVTLYADSRDGLMHVTEPDLTNSHTTGRAAVLDALTYTAPVPLAIVLGDLQARLSAIASLGQNTTARVVSATLEEPS